MDYSEDYKIFFPDKKIFLSRNHNWAFAAWEIGRLRGYINPRASLIHIDGHLDYCEPHGEASKIETEIQAIKYAKKLSIAEFIIPTQRNGTIEKVYMISDDTVYVGEDEKFKRAYTLNHYEDIHKRKWISEIDNKSNSVILDLDLDYFNKNYQDWDYNPVLLTDEQIKQQLEYFKNRMWDWDMITVALSPEFCGGIEPCNHLFKLFLEVFELDLNNAIEW